MRKLILEPVIASEDVIVQFTAAQEIAKNILITVPSSFKAILYINEEALVRVDEINKGSIYKLLGKDKSYLGKSLKVAFIRTNKLPQLEWGFGLINVKTDEEKYIIGANGEIQVKIADRIKLINSFGLQKNIDLDMLAVKVKGYIKNVGTAIFGSFLNDNKVSYDETDKYIANLRNKMKTELESEKIFKELGIEIEDLNIRSFAKSGYENIVEVKQEVTKEDLKKLKNEMSKKIEDVSNRIINSKDLEAFKDEILEQIEENSKNTITQDDLDNLREELQESISDLESDEDNINSIDKINEVVSDLENRLNISLNTKINSVKQILDNYLDEKEQNKLELFDNAKEEYLNNLKITTDLLIDKAVSNEDLAAPAGMIYSNIEKNLMNSPKLINNGFTFIAAQNDYYDAAQKIMTDGSINLLNAFSKKVVETKDGIDYLEVPTEFRFIIYGLSVADAFQAARDWTLINKCRHLSSENEAKLERALKDRGQTRKEFLKSTLEFYRRVKLYTKD